MPNGIDAPVILGLAGKLTEVFASSDTYLSFPLAPMGFSQTRLRALTTDAMSPEGQRAQAEFSLLVNEIPDGPVWSPAGDGRLWDVYGDVLDAAELAQATRTDAQEQDYQAARATLMVTNPDGTLSDSATVVAYEQCRDAYVALAAEYNNRRGAAQTTTDPAVSAAWALDEPLLMARLAEAERDWATLGQRAVVEHARRVLQELGSSAPVEAWADCRRRFDPDLPEIFFRTSPDGSMYLPTSCVPSDIVDTTWPSMTLAGSDLSNNALRAPADLRARFQAGASSPGVDLVSYEYSPVTVSRPWFSPQVFASRAWRFYDSQRVLCDGGRPPRGECTAWVSGLILARNIRVTRPHDRDVDMAFLPSSRRPLALAPRANPSSLVMARLDARRALVSRLSARSPKTPAGVPKPGRLAQRPFVRTAVPTRPPTHSPARTTGATAEPRAVVHPAIGATQLITSRRRPVPLRSPEPGRSASKTFATDPGELFILAFVCQQMPQAPNPDPTLEW